MLRISISWKLLAASAVVGAVATAIAVNGLRRIHAQHEQLVRLVDYSSEKVKLAAVLKQDLMAITRAEKNLILAPDLEAMQGHAAAIDDTFQAMAKDEERLRDLVDDDDQVQLDTFAARWLEWRRIHREVRAFAQLNSSVRARQLVLGKGRVVFDALHTALGELSKAVDDAPQITPPEPPQGEVTPPRLADLVQKLLLVAVQLQHLEKNVLLAASGDEQDPYDTSFAPLLEQMRADLRSIRELTPDDSLMALISAEQAFEEYADYVAEIRGVLQQRGSFFVYQFAFEMGAPLASECERMLDEIIAQNERDLQTSRSQSDQTYESARNNLLGFSAVGIVLSVAVTYFTGRHIAHNLWRLAEYTRKMRSTGDLSEPVPRVSSDEVGMLAQSFDHLRQSLHHQTSELAALNLALEQKNREMEQFVYTISHDLSSPLVSCKGLVGLIQSDVASENFAEVVASSRKLDAAVDQLGRIIHDLLTLSRIGRKPLHKSSLDVAKLLADLHEELRSRLAEVQAELHIEPGLPLVVADASDVKRVFENLIHNAIKYACAGDRRVITIGGAYAAEEIRYFVRDSGPGIDPAYHEKIFGLFYRLDTDRPGTGVGLASVSKTMRMHGGRAWVESTVGTGATFWIAFPRQAPAGS